MSRPRNTLVICRLLKQDSKQYGAITVPNGNDCYSNAEIIALPIGTVDAAGGQPATHDLQVGQLVFVKHKRRSGPGLGQFQDEGVSYEENGETFYLFEQTNILTIRAEPGQWSHSKPEDKVAAA